MHNPKLPNIQTVLLPIVLLMVFLNDRVSVIVKGIVA